MIMSSRPQTLDCGSIALSVERIVIIPLLIPILLCCAPPVCKAYDPPGDPNYRASQAIFDDSTIPVIKITIHPPFLEEILFPGNETNESYYPCSLRFTNHLIDDSISSVGLRLRGKVSRYEKKKSFKISFNDFSKGRHFRGLKKFNLNAECADPSLIRTKLCWDMFNQFGVPSSRANHVRLYINDEYRGLYLHVEHVDTTFVRGRFGNRNGNLFKCNFVSEQADLAYLENGRYDLCGSGLTYELMNNNVNPNYSDLSRFIDILNNVPDHFFIPEIEKVFNVDGFLKWMAVSLHCGSWDDYLWNGSNYYLYRNTDTGRFEFIPYDYNQSLGIDAGDKDLATRNVYEFRHPAQPRPLAERVLSQKKYKERYTFYLNAFVNQVFKLERLEPRIIRLKNMITEAAQEEAYRMIAFRWSMDDFHRSCENAVSANISLGVKPYIRLRREATLDQIPPVPARTLPLSETIPRPDSSFPDEIPPLPTLVINEICASNRTIIKDSAGDYDDWIEVYNYGTEPVSMGGMFLTDNRANPGRHRIPEGIIVPAGKYALFWADADVSQGPYHLNFKLSRSGEMVGLYEKTSRGLREIDLVIFGPQTPDASYGRVKDGAPQWRRFHLPTPGASNR